MKTVPRTFNRHRLLMPFYALAGCCLLLLAVVDTRPAAAAPETPIRVLLSDAQSVQLELNVTDYALAARDGTGTVEVRIDGMDQSSAPGNPRAPVQSALIGVPTTAGLALEIVAAEYETIPGYDLPLAAGEQEEEIVLPSLGENVLRSPFLPEPRILMDDRFYPQAPALIGGASYMRNQAVATVRFSPVQFNPVRHELRIYRRLSVRLTWQELGENVERVTALDDRATADVYSRLLNRNDLYRQTPAKQVDASAAKAERKTCVQVASGEPGENAAAVPLKIAIAASGVYGVTYEQLVLAGWTADQIDPQKLTLCNQGETIAIELVGLGNDTFDELRFYGTAADSRFTTENVYWLTPAGDAKRMGPPDDGAPDAGQPNATTLDEKRHFEEDTTYWQNMRGVGTSEPLDRWFWASRLSPNTATLDSQRDYLVALGDYVGGDATLTIALKSFTRTSHRTRIWMNEVLLTQEAGIGWFRPENEEFKTSLAVPARALKAGLNTITVETMPEDDNPDQILVNWFDLAYTHGFDARGSVFQFETAQAREANGDPAQQYAVRGVGTGTRLVYDITVPHAPTRVTGTQENGATTTFARARDGERTYLVLTSDQIKRPARIEADTPSTWHSPANGADYIIITHDRFMAAATKLANHRQAVDGLRTAVVPVDELYDEFTDGLFSPHAIGQFLVYATDQWQQPAPQAVVLMGDANQDYKARLPGTGTNFLPSYNIENSLFGEISSDLWYVLLDDRRKESTGDASDTNEDTMPDLQIGRLAVETPEEADTVVAKILGYDTNPPAADWNTRVLLVADNEEKFEETHNLLSALVPFHYNGSETSGAANVLRVDAQTFESSAAATSSLSETIVSALNSGVVLANYAGHGDYDAWGRWARNQDGVETKFIFHNQDVNELVNGARLPIITVGNCLNGFFAGPTTRTSLAEAFLRRPDGGAVGIWAPTGFGYPTGHQELLGNFYRALFYEDAETLGEATSNALLATVAADNFWWDNLARTYVLFGDPMQHLALPNPPYITEIEPGVNGSLAIDAGVEVKFHKPVPPDSVKLTIDGLPGVAFTAISGLLNNRGLTDSITFVPDRILPHGTEVSFRIDAKDNRGQPLRKGLAPSSWTVTVSDDDIPPTLALRIGDGQKQGALASLPVHLAFSEPVRAESVDFRIQPFVAGRLLWVNAETGMWEESPTVDSEEAYFVHNAAFIPGSTYDFTVTAARDTAGNKLLEPVSLRFTASEPREELYLPSVFSPSRR